MRLWRANADFCFGRVREQHSEENHQILGRRMGALDDHDFKKICDRTPKHR